MKDITHYFWLGTVIFVIAGICLFVRGLKETKKGERTQWCFSFLCFLIAVFFGVFSLYNADASGNVSQGSQAPDPPTVSSRPTGAAKATEDPNPIPTEQIKLTISRSYDPVANLRQIAFSGASATSELIDDSAVVWGASKAIDGNLQTNWQEGAADYGVGEKLILYFSQETEISYIQIYPGFAASANGSDEYVFSMNGRPNSLQFDFSDGSSCTYTQIQDKNEGILLKLSHPVTTSFVQITILGSYEAPYQDTAISEVSAYR